MIPGLSRRVRGFESRPLALEVTAARWRHASFYDKRYSAAKRLVTCRDLSRATKRDVLRLLGRPEEKQARTWVYNAGYLRSSMGPDYTVSFDISFDGNGRVRAAAVPNYETFP